MTPTPTVLLLVALFWTLPASVGVLVYRKHGSLVEPVTAAAKSRFDRVMEGLQKPQPQADA